MKYLITGATGDVGSGVTRCLLEHSDRPCVLVCAAEKARALFGKRIEVRGGDLAGLRASLSAAIVGIDAAFLVSGGPKLAAWDRACALAARASGVKHVVKLSRLDGSTGVGTGPWHAPGEAAIRESGLSFTFLLAQRAESCLRRSSRQRFLEGKQGSKLFDLLVRFEHERPCVNGADFVVRAMVRNRLRGYWLAPGVLA